jgi:hypothetical protein
MFVINSRYSSCSVVRVAGTILGGVAGTTPGRAAGAILGLQNSTTFSNTTVPLIPIISLIFWVNLSIVIKTTIVLEIEHNFRIITALKLHNLWVVSLNVFSWRNVLVPMHYTWKV